MDAVGDILHSCGLGHVSSGFGGMGLKEFRELLIQDYEKHGVHDVVDKQNLFRAIKELNRRESVNGSTVSEVEECGVLERCNSMDGEDVCGDGQVGQDGVDQDVQLLDLDGEDGVDFLDSRLDAEAFSDAFMEITSGQEQEMEAQMHASGDGKSAVLQQGDGYGRSSDVGNHGGEIRAKYGGIDLQEIADPPRIRVIVRKRPLNAKEMERGEVDVLECNTEESVLTVHEPRAKVDLTKYTETHCFRFDDVFDTDVDNDSLYAQTVRPLIATVFKSGRGTCFAYGQTGSGKTYTMQPLPLRAASDILHISQRIEEFKHARLAVSCYEIYGGKVFDLLNDRQRLEVREDAKRRVQVVGLKEIEVSGVHELSRLCDHAACARSTGSTGANDESSRSHSIMTFSIRLPRTSQECAKVNKKIGSQHKNSENLLKTIGRLSFIDLAGSERGADTYENDKQTRLEGAEINKSLLALKECIRALDMDAGHVPFRGSKLTSVLRDSFTSKNARTVMIANVSPSSSSCEHTLNTLRYADRVKEIKKDEAIKRKTIALSVDPVSKFLMNLPPPIVPPSSSQPTMAAKQAEGPKPALPRKSTTTASPKKVSMHATRRSVSHIETSRVASQQTPKDVVVAHPISRAASDSFASDKSLPNARRDTSDGAMDLIESYEEDLTFAHRQHIESMMSGLREEMELLAKTDMALQDGVTMEEYVEELGTILIERAAAIASLQQQVSLFKRRMRSL
eukprot:jgi/Picsp_1/680/NSC_00674-R1_kinesin-like protein kif2a-like